MSRVHGSAGQGCLGSTAPRLSADAVRTPRTLNRTAHGIPGPPTVGNRKSSTRTPDTGQRDLQKTLAAPTRRFPRLGDFRRVTARSEPAFRSRRTTSQSCGRVLAVRVPHPSFAKGAVLSAISAATSSRPTRQNSTLLRLSARFIVDTRISTGLLYSCGKIYRTCSKLVCSRYAYVNTARLALAYPRSRSFLLASPNSRTRRQPFATLLVSRPSKTPARTSLEATLPAGAEQLV